MQIKLKVCHFYSFDILSRLQTSVDIPIVLKRTVLFHKEVIHVTATDCVGGLLLETYDSVAIRILTNFK